MLFLYIINKWIRSLQHYKSSPSRVWQTKIGSLSSAGWFHRSPAPCRPSPPSISTPSLLRPPSTLHLPGLGFPNRTSSSTYDWFTVFISDPCCLTSALFQHSTLSFEFYLRIWWEENTRRPFKLIHALLFEFFWYQKWEIVMPRPRLRIHSVLWRTTEPMEHFPL
jgi:hypothetical protein